MQVRRKEAESVIDVVLLTPYIDDTTECSHGKYWNRQAHQIMDPNTEQTVY